MAETPSSDPRRDDARAAPGRRTTRALNAPLLLGTLIAGAVLLPAAHFWHSYQTRCIADAFLARAETLKESDDYRAAAQYFHWYLRLFPADQQAQVSLADAYDKSAKDLAGKSRAIELYYPAVAAVSSTQDVETAAGLRRRLAELLLEVGRFAAAEAEAKKLPNTDAQGWRSLALALNGQAQNEASPAAQAAAGAGLRNGSDAAWREGTIGHAFAGKTLAEAFQRALELNPGDIDLSVRLARICRGPSPLSSDEQEVLSGDQRAAMADKLVDEMVAKNPDSAEAFLARYEYRTTYGLPGAEEDLEAAAARGPEDLKVMLAAGAHARREAEHTRREAGPAEAIAGRYQAARDYYARAIQIAPSDERAYLGLGLVLLAQGETEQALEVWRRGLEKCGRDSIELNWRLAAVLVAEGPPDQARSALDTLDRVIQSYGRMLTQQGRLSLNRSFALLRASWLVKTGQYEAALPLLKHVVTGGQGTAAEAEEGLRARILLGQAHGGLGKWEDAAAAYRDAAALSPKLVEARLAAAEAWLRGGRPERAVQEYQQALTIADAPETWFLLAVATFREQAQLPEDARDWDRLARALGEVKKRAASLVDPWRLALLEADSELAQAGQRGEPDRGAGAAAGVLRQAETAYPDSAGFMERLVPAYERLNLPDDADRALSRLDQIAPDSPAPYVLRSMLCCGRGQFAEARDALSRGLEDLPAEAHPIVTRALTQVAIEEASAHGNKDQLLAIYNENPSNPAVIVRLAGLALAAKDFTELKHWEEKLLELEGPGGAQWRYFRARRLLASVKTADDPEAKEAARLVAEIQSLQPGSAEGHLLNALVQQLQGNLQEAVKSYQQAIHLGKQTASAYEQLLALLCRAQRYEEAAEYFAKAQAEGLASDALRSLEIAIALGRGEFERAVELAYREVQLHPEDAVVQLRYGQALFSAKQSEKAEAALRRAVDLAPGDVRTHNALFTFYVRSGQPDSARSALENLTRSVKMSEVQRALVFAAGYEALGDRDRAIASYREVTRLDPANVAAQIQLARLVQEGDPDEAEQILRRIAPDSPLAQRMLAAVLADSGQEEKWEEALKLLEPASAEGSEAAAAERLKATLLVLRGGEENRLAARRIIEGLVRDSSTSADTDRVLLASLYEAEGRLQAAREQYVALVARANPNPSHLAMYVDHLLRHGLAPDAGPWLEKLEAVAPAELATVALKARWLKAQGSESQIEPLVEPLGKRLLEASQDNSQEAAGVCLRIGALYDSVERFGAAQQWYERLRELLPERYEPLAMSLARQGQMTDAISLCSQAARSDNSAHPALALASVLLGGQPTAEDFQQAEPVLATALANHQADVAVLNAVANVRVVQERLGDAEKLYRRVLTIEPDDLSALNNLATLLAEQPGKTSEALDCVEHALGVAKNRRAQDQAVLLDTKGMVLVYQGRADEAVPLLVKAASAANADPRYHFHLAVAYDRIGEVEKARNSLESARAGNVQRQVLTKSDRELLDQLQDKLGFQ